MEPGAAMRQVRSGSNVVVQAGYQVLLYPF